MGCGAHAAECVLRELGSRVLMCSLRTTQGTCYRPGVTLMPRVSPVVQSEGKSL